MSAAAATLDAGGSPGPVVGPSRRALLTRALVIAAGVVFVLAVMAHGALLDLFHAPATPQGRRPASAEGAQPAV